MQDFHKQYHFWVNKASSKGLTGSWKDAYAVTAIRAQQGMPTMYQTADAVPVVVGGELVQNPNYQRDIEFNIHSEGGV